MVAINRRLLNRKVDRGFLWFGHGHSYVIGVKREKLSSPRRDEEQWYRLVVLGCVLANIVIFDEPEVTTLDKLSC